MKANRAARRLDKDDRAVAGVVAGILMLGGIVAFLAYMNVAWMPKWIESKESSYSATLNTGMSGWADLAESQVARNQTSRSFSSTFALGLRGIPLLGTGSSTGTLGVLDGPTLNVSVGSLPILTAGGSLALTTHTMQFPNQTLRYTLGAMEVVQSDGAWVDLRNLVNVQRTVQGRLSLVLQAVNITSQAQQVGGSGEASAIGVLVNVTTATDASPSPMRVTLIANGVEAGAWRAALNRTLNAGGLTGVRQDCSAAIASGVHYCYPSQAANNTATRAEIVFLDVETGWTRQAAKVAVTVAT